MQRRLGEKMGGSSCAFKGDDGSDWEMTIRVAENIIGMKIDSVEAKS